MVRPEAYRAAGDAAQRVFLAGLAASLLLAFAPVAPSAAAQGVLDPAASTWFETEQGKVRLVALLHDTVVASNAAGTLQVQNDNNTNVFGTARGRAGYIWDNWLFYGTGGFAWSYTEITRTQQVGVIGGAGPGTGQSLFATPTGWVAGAGLEWAFAPQWTARLEYLHLDLGPTSFMFTSAGLRRDVEFTMDVFRVGVNYRFNLLSLGP